MMFGSFLVSSSRIEKSVSINNFLPEYSFRLLGRERRKRGRDRDGLLCSSPDSGPYLISTGGSLVWCFCCVT